MQCPFLMGPILYTAETRQLLEPICNVLTMYCCFYLQPSASSRLILLGLLQDRGDVLGHTKPSKYTGFFFFKLGQRRPTCQFKTLNQVKIHGWFRNFRNLEQSFENKKSLLTQPWQPRKSGEILQTSCSPANASVCKSAIDFL